MSNQNGKKKQLYVVGPNSLRFPVRDQGQINQYRTIDSDMGWWVEESDDIATEEQLRNWEGLGKYILQKKTPPFPHTPTTVILEHGQRSRTGSLLDMLYPFDTNNTVPSDCKPILDMFTRS